MTILTLLAMTFCLTLLALFWNLNENLSVTQKGSQVQQHDFTIFLPGNSNEIKLNTIKNNVQAFHLIQEVNHLNQDEVDLQLKTEFPEKLGQMISDAPPLQVLQGKFTAPKLSSDEETELRKHLDSYDLIIDYDLGASPLSDDSAQKLFNWATLFLIFVFCAVALLISHLIKVILDSGKNENELLLLLGAPLKLRIFPLLTQAFSLTTLGILLSLGCLFLFHDFVLPRISAWLLPEGTPLQFLSFSSVLKLSAFTFASTLTGCFLSWPNNDEKIAKKI